LVAVLRYPGARSCSPETHSAAYPARGQNWYCVASEVPPERLEGAEPAAGAGTRR